MAPQASHLRAKEQISWTRFPIAPTETTPLSGRWRNLVLNEGCAAMDVKKRMGCYSIGGKRSISPIIVNWGLSEAHHDYLMLATLAGGRQQNLLLATFYVSISICTSMDPHCPHLKSRHVVWLLHKGGKCSENKLLEALIPLLRPTSPFVARPVPFRA